MAAPYSILKHRSAFNLHSTDPDVNPMARAMGAVVDWLLSREGAYGSSPIADDIDEQGAYPLVWDYAMPEDYAGGDYDDDHWPALRCASVLGPDGEPLRWVMEYDEPDASHDDRRWHTTVCLVEVDKATCAVALQSMCRPLPNCTEPLPEVVAAPSLVRTLLELPACVAKAGTMALTTTPVKLTPESFDAFAALLTDPGRTAPMVLFCTGLAGKMPEHAKQTARRCLGTADVFVLDFSDPSMVGRLNALFHRGEASGEYACPKQSARAYLPGVDLTDYHGSRKHESWTPAELDSQHAGKFAEHLARRFMPDAPVLTVADLEA